MKKELTTPSGDPISSMCFGTMQFGGNADENASREMFDACIAAGLNFFDTAYVYTEGRSETILGNLVRKSSDDIFIATKCASSGGASRANILAQFEASQKRLGLDCIDLFYLHQWNSNDPLEETIETLASLRDKGKIRHIGVSNFSAWQVMKAQTVAKSFGIEIAMLQPMYNLVKRQAEVEILPMSLSEGFAVCPYSPLGGGLLTGKYAAGQNGRLSTDKSYEKRYGQAWMHQSAAELSKLASELGISAITLAVAWVANNPAITAPIISARSAEQLQPSLDALNLTLDDSLYDQLSALSPKPAPANDRTDEV
ncbi:MAG: aldo/keto reductase [Marinosulfonomonas sp.]|nr:MAG: aldo/keto reductase [Marinosulfonomonas sp.]